MTQTKSRKSAKTKAKAAAKNGLPPKKRQIKFVRPWLYPEQEEFLYNPARYSVVEAATKCGKTHGCIVWFIEQAAITGGKNKNYWWVAPNYNQAEIAFRRVLQYIPESLRRPNNTKLTVTLPNGAVMWFKSGEKSDALYGEDVYAAVIDEATRMRETSWIAIRTTLTATRGQCRIIGNVKGRKNWAYKLARKAEAGAPNTYFARLDAYTAAKYGIYPIEEIEDAKNTLPPEAFKELYLAIPTEDGANPFGHDNINACASNGLASGPAVAYGVDVARLQDWTVIIGLNKNLEVCYFERFQKVPWPEVEDRVMRIVKHIPTFMDSTGVGDPVLAHVQAKCTAVEGYHFNARSKQALIENLTVGVQRQRLKFPGLKETDSISGHNDPRLVMQEMKDFEYEYTRTGVLYTAPEGLHDDCVCALALAYMCATQNNYNAVKPYTEKVYAPYAV